MKMIFALLALCVFAVLPARAQFIGFTSPQTAQQPVFTNVNAPTTFLIQNLGQNVHWLTYTTAGLGTNNLTSLDIRLEGSNDGVVFFPISDDATDVQGGQVFCTSFYPVIRANLVSFVIASGTPTLSASYSGTSSTVPLPLGATNPNQTTRRPIFLTQTASANHTAGNIIAPFGSTLGYIVLVTNAAGNFPGGSSLTLQLNYAAGAFQTVTITLPSPQQSTTTWIPVNAMPAATVGIQYVSGGASLLTFSAYYIFLSPSLPNALVSPDTQPPQTLNSETVSAVNTPIALIVGSGQLLAPTQRIHLYSVSARCSAGTGSLTVADGSTTIWTTAATEVGTTTFRYQWNPGLATTLAAHFTVTLSTCGGGNTGTLDVQASEF